MLKRRKNKTIFNWAQIRLTKETDILNTFKGLNKNSTAKKEKTFSLFLFYLYLELRIYNNFQHKVSKKLFIYLLKYK